MLKSVAIVGNGITKNNLFVKEGQDLWVIAYGSPELVERSERVFEIHKKLPANKQYRKDLKKIKTPIYMHKKKRNIPASIEYPLDKMIGKFGQYFTNTICYMLAMAIDEKYKEIALFGVDYIEEERYAEKAATEYFLGMARGLGSKLLIPLHSNLLQAEVYGL